MYLYIWTIGLLTFFADDATYHISGKNKTEIAPKLQHDGDK